MAGSEPSTVDFSVVHAVPGLGKRLDYVPSKTDPMYVGEQLPTALLQDAITSEMFSCDESVKKAFLPLLTLRELRMLQFMNEVTDKQDWQKKVFDVEITAKWRTEVEPLNFTDGMFNHCIEELQYKAKNIYQDPNTPIAVYNGDVVKSDTALPESLKLALQNAVKVLEHVPEKEKDWHPGSNDMVLDLVHPSLFPLVYGKSRVLKVGDKTLGLNDCVNRCGEGAVLELSKNEKPKKTRRSPDMNPFSTKFQWLPCEVDISGDHAKIVSYINNLHPRHAELYGIVEKVIDAAIPLWERTLAPLYADKMEYHQRVPCTNVKYEGDEDEPENPEGDGDNEGIDEDDAEDREDAEDDLGEGAEVFGATDAENGDEGEGSIGDASMGGTDDGHESGEDDGEQGDENKDDSSSDSSSSGSDSDNDAEKSDVEEEAGEGENEDEGEDDEEDEDDPRRVPIQPEAAPFDARKLAAPKPISFKELYGKTKRPLQIIVKLANIELTPEKPKYAGGAWHVEGKQNEHICATALCYYSSSNIKASHLAFRQFVESETVNEFDYDQGHFEFLEELFGCKNEEGATQDVGKVETKEGRLLSFPNILQHQVQPFELVDPTKSGHRKILALFLVDPNVRVISTATVPCQQLDWWRAATVSGATVGRPAKGFDKLPVELKDQVFDEVDGFPISLDEAKDIRGKLMKERKKFVKQHANALAENNAFSLCEH